MAASIPSSKNALLPSLRTTQRAPRSCRSCATRKIKCDKLIPCSTCVKRGESETCARETVIVRGQVTTGRDPSTQPTYEELLQENARLRDLTMGGRERRRPFQPVALPHPTRGNSLATYNDDDYYETVLFKATATRPPIERMQQHDIIIPSRRCSEILIQHDKKWNSWVHYAVEYPDFERQHDDFMDRLEAGADLDTEDPAWLAIYFAILTVIWLHVLLFGVVTN